ncbi:heat shock protein [Plasmodium cynomolgi strain B]|uniref:Heat shock protein n=1 Tax=Plasmodium cynomolgi (strain B) TaxID=1120755 RepID=K6UNC5_PLACD|nr:heat shock protein [Plasmodium cynomolgi strain B]GAB69363.1 heat shock protein [Plasmodium cynomolgi strain B]
MATSMKHSRKEIINVFHFSVKLFLFSFLIWIITGSNEVRQRNEEKRKYSKTSWKRFGTETLEKNGGNSEHHSLEKKVDPRDNRWLAEKNNLGESPPERDHFENLEDYYAILGVNRDATNLEIKRRTEN